MVLPTLAVVVFLLAGAALSSVEVDASPPLAKLAFQGTADDPRPLLMAVSSTMITVTGLVFALTIVTLQIASGQYSVGHRRGLPAPAPRPGAGGAVPRASAWATG